jgi:hypothetical protein
MTVSWFHPEGRYSRQLTKHAINAAHVALMYDETQNPVFVVSCTVEMPQARRFQDHYSLISHQTSNIGSRLVTETPCAVSLGSQQFYYRICTPPGSTNSPRLQLLVSATEV